MPLTGAPAARFPRYLLPNQFDRFPALDENGHDPETLDMSASEHCSGCDAGWIDPAEVYITDGDERVEGFRKADGAMASAEEVEAEALRYSANFAADARMCHVYNHSHECKPTCFKKTEYKKPSAEEIPKQQVACRFRFWRLVSIAGRLLRRSGKALVTEPTVWCGRRR